MSALHRLRHLPIAASLLFLAAAAPASADPVTPIAEARTKPAGTIVTVEGSVSTPAGAFASSFADQGFGLQDATGGLFVSLKNSVRLGPPQRARVTGAIADHSGLLVVVPADVSGVQTLARGPVIVPLAVKTSGIGEATEGRIVRVEGKVTAAPESDAPYGFKVQIDDGSGAALIFVNNETHISMNGFVLGKSVAVTGFSSQYETHYEVEPRSSDDINSSR